jgi:hypothetical protein
MVETTTLSAGEYLDIAKAVLEKSTDFALCEKFIQGLSSLVQWKVAGVDRILFRQIVQKRWQEEEGELQKLMWQSWIFLSREQQELEECFETKEIFSDSYLQAVLFRKMAFCEKYKKEALKILEQDKSDQGQQRAAGSRMLQLEESKRHIKTIKYRNGIRRKKQPTNIKVWCIKTKTH